MRNKRKEKRMTDYTSVLPVSGTTSGFDEIAKLFDLFSPTTSIAGGKEETISVLLNNKYFLEEIERVRKDFIINHNNLRKYPRFDEKDWE